MARAWLIQRGAPENVDAWWFVSRGDGEYTLVTDRMAEAEAELVRLGVPSGDREDTNADPR